jgi:hypothetical protein
VPAPALEPGLAPVPAPARVSQEPARDAAPAPQQPATVMAPRASEAELLSLARARLRAGDFDSALALVSQLERRYPQGTLAQERALLEIRALQGQGLTAQAEQRAARFVERYPDSPYAAALAEPLRPGPEDAKPARGR